MSNFICQCFLLGGKGQCNGSWGVTCDKKMQGYASIRAIHTHSDNTRIRKHAYTHTHTRKQGLLNEFCVGVVNIVVVVVAPIVMKCTNLLSACRIRNIAIRL